MKKISVFICAYLWTIFLFVSISAQDFKTIQDGIEYAEIERKIDNQPVKMNLLRLDLTKVRLDVVHALDAAIGVEKTSSMATRHGAIAAINAGFFRLDKSIFAGDAAGVLQIDGKLLSESSNNRIALGITNKRKKTGIVFGQVKAYSGISFPGNLSIHPDGINREAKKNEAIIYTPEFKETPKSDSVTTEIIIKDCQHVCWKLEFVEGNGGTTIPENGYIVSFNDEKRNLIDSAKRKMLSGSSQLTVVVGVLKLPNSKKNKFRKVEDVVNGVPQLIKNGKIDITWEQEKSSKSFVETKHPRTAVALLKDGKLLMVTVDGRSEASGGIGLEDLAKLFLEFGATDAMNLDGGGSTTMFLGGKIVNHPSDKEGERKVSDAILVFPRKPKK